MIHPIYQKLAYLVGSLGLMLLLLGSGPVAAQEAVKMTNQEWQSEFRDHITFTIEAESSAEIVEADLFYRVVGQLATSRNEAEFTPGKTISAEFKIDQTDPSNYFPPGTELEYWWKLVDAEGNELKTERETLLYLDDNHEWQTLENERLSLFWYEGNEDFGQSLFDRANEALDTLQTDIGIELEDPIKIFIYDSHQDLMGALATTAQEWTGGVAFTTYGVVIIGISPGQLEWGLNAMTHEMTHLVIHQATDNPFSGLPRWLDEGIAVYNENRDELDDDFRLLFEQAVENDQLMTLRTLSSPFPGDPMQANLAYGQSGAVVKFMVDTYGPETMSELLSIFAEGALYDEALEQAIGMNTDELDNAFRASLELPPLPGTETASTEGEVAIAEEETNSEEVEVAEPQPTPVEEAEPAAPVEPTSAPAPAPAVSETADSPLSFLPCVGGIVALLLMGGFVYTRSRFI
jgi:hypothetical protein